MQKLDFTKNIELIIDKLFSNQIVSIFEEWFWRWSAYNYWKLNEFLFLSKSWFDEIYRNPAASPILINLGVEELYSPSALSKLTTIFRTAQAYDIISEPLALKFYLSHNTLISSLKLTEWILFQDSNILENLDSNENNDGIIIFEILIEDDYLGTDKYIKILTLMSDLFETVGKILWESETANITLLDSWSNSNIGFEGWVETAKSIFLIFKEIWTWAISRKHYKQKLDQSALFDSLQIRSMIEEKRKEWIITDDEAREYNHIIKNRTNDLIGLWVLPKKIVIESRENIWYERTLQQVSEVKYLNSWEANE